MTARRIPEKQRSRTTKRSATRAVAQREAGTIRQEISSSSPYRANGVASPRERTIQLGFFAAAAVGVNAEMLGVGLLDGDEIPILLNH